MSHSQDYYEHLLDEAQEREYTLQEKLFKLQSRVEDLETALQKLADGDHPGTPINKGSAAMALIEEALGRSAE